VTTTIHLDAEGIYHPYSTVDLVKAAVDVLNDGMHLVLGDGDMDYAAANLLVVLAVMHDQTGINLELLPQARAFAVTILDGRWPE
jgi:hypothetical protein